MKKKRYRGEWAGCSDFEERLKELKRNHESPKTKALLAKLDAEWEVKVTKVKRPRIKKEAEPRNVIIKVLGKELTVTFVEYKERCQALEFEVVKLIF